MLKDPFDLALMDLTVVGGMGGKEAAAQLLAQEPGARLVVSSGYSNDPVMAAYRAAGFCAVLEKPYTVEQLKHVLDRAADRASSSVAR